MWMLDIYKPAKHHYEPDLQLNAAKSSGPECHLWFLSEA